MPTPVPVPITFRLPDGWLPARPETVGPGIAFASVHPHPDAGFAADITLDGDIPPEGTTLAELAAESTRRMAALAESVTVTSLHEFGSADAPTLTQRLTFTTLAGGVRRDLVQSQVYLSLVDTEEPRKCGVMRPALTATATQHAHVVGDFRRLLRSVRPTTEKEA
ncbi:hypothetical protein OG625_28205 [Streptomyces sp. NBC_01351]|uniref:hypothetical protein n=1 Tax=Streptomyces sp. NBC_01351 TaxID=2903833 RepID=UPI002E35D500|nr:hypothetical protein [Streptomyces sp. NBC_01351]